MAAEFQGLYTRQQRQLSIPKTCAPEYQRGWDIVRTAGPWRKIRREQLSTERVELTNLRRRFKTNFIDPQQQPCLHEGDPKESSVISDLRSQAKHGENSRRPF